VNTFKHKHIFKDWKTRYHKCTFILWEFLLWQNNSDY